MNDKTKNTIVNSSLGVFKQVLNTIISFVPYRYWNRNVRFIFNKYAIYKKFKVEEIVPLNKISLIEEPDEGNSFLLKSGEEKYLMVETSTSFNWIGTRLKLYDINNVDGNFSKYLHDNDQEDHNGNRHKLFVFSYIEGEMLKDYLLKVNNEEAYNLGIL